MSEISGAGPKPVNPNIAGAARTPEQSAYEMASKAAKMPTGTDDERNKAVMAFKSAIDQTFKIREQCSQEGYKGASLDTRMEGFKSNMAGLINGSNLNKNDKASLNGVLSTFTSTKPDEGSDEGSSDRGDILRAGERPASGKTGQIV